MAGSDLPVDGNDQTGVNEETGVCYVVLCMYRQVQDRTLWLGLTDLQVVMIKQVYVVMCAHRQVPNSDPAERCDKPAGGGGDDQTGVCCVVCVYTDRNRTGTLWLGLIYLQVVVIKQVLMNKQMYVVLCVCTQTGTGRGPYGWV